MTDYRNLPPVEPVEIPRRFSQTLIAKDDECARSAYLYLKHEGGAGSHNLDRGTLAHEVFERGMRMLIAAEARSFTEPEMRRRFRGAGDDTLVEVEPAPGEVAAIMAQLVDEVLRDRPELVVPRREVDNVREMAYHWAVAYDVDPETVLGLEQLMVLDLDCGWTISGKLDVLTQLAPELGGVDDYKSSQAIPSQAEYEGSTQPWLYAALACFGVLVTRTPCLQCDQARVPLGGICPAGCHRGYIEHRGEQIGKGLRGVLTRQIHPHPKPRDDGLLHHRELLLSRTAIADFVADLETKAVRLAERFETWQFPARSSGGSENGSWCSRCPAPLECPLPATLRNHAGSINTLDQATEAWTWAQHHKAEVAAVEKEAKNFAKAHDVAIVVGDQQWRWEPREGRALRRAGRGSDWDGLVHAVTEAVEFGTPFRIDEFVKPTVSNGFTKSKIGESG